MYNGTNHSYQDIDLITGNVDIDDDTMSELHAQLSLYIDQSLGYHEGELGVRARRSWEYYYGKLPLPVCNGASSWVDRTVWESVNGTVQELSNVFTNGEDAVKFKPIDSRDGPDSIAATKLVNSILLQQNPGYKILNDAFKEACVTRNAFIKRWWDVEVNTVMESFDGISEDQLAIFIAQLKDSGDFVAVEEEVDEETGSISGTVSYRGRERGSNN